MPYSEEIIKMQEQGRTDSEIVEALRRNGLSESQIQNSISEARIKNAVSGDIDAPAPGEDYNSNNSYKNPAPQYEEKIVSEISTPEENYDIEVPSMITGNAQEASEVYQESGSSEVQQDNQQDYTPNNQQDYQQDYSQNDSQNYSQQYPLGAETLSELAEQILEEKLFPLSSKFEKISIEQTTSDSKIKSINSRLERIEKILDTIQLNVIQKLGDYSNNISDIKKEIIETQKTFKSTKRKSKK
jgi:hypothetical protein